MSTSKKYYLVFIVCSILIYEMPYCLTLLKTGWTPLPPALSVDQFLYLNLSSIRHASATEVLNPWYGDRVPDSAVLHLRFPITFLLFRLTHWLFRSWTAATLVWTGIWAALTFAAASFCLSSLFPNGDRRMVAIGAFGLLVLQSPLTYAAEFLRLPSTAGLLELSLPFSRFAFPQVIVPVVLVYWGLQVRALKSGSRRQLLGMGALQFGAFVAFPYILPVIALGTAIAVAAVQHRRSEIALSLKAIFLFAVACGIVDMGYVVLAGLRSTNGNVQFALQFRREMIFASFRPYVALLVLGAIVALMSRASWPARATVAGLALSNALFAFSNVLFPPSTQMLSHINYILTLTTWLPFIVAGWYIVERFVRLRVGLVILLALAAAWEGYATYSRGLWVNIVQAAAIYEIEKVALTPKDLVIAPGQFPDDISSWVPLVSSARVLYTPNAENILSLDSIRTEQTSRQGLYLTLSGMDFSRLISIADSRPELFSSLEQHADRGYQTSPLEGDRLSVGNRLKERLGPLLSQIQSNPASVNSLFTGYQRVVVIDNSNHPFFQSSAFAPWLRIERAYQHNTTLVWICRPNAGL